MSKELCDVLKSLYHDDGAALSTAILLSGIEGGEALGDFARDNLPFIQRSGVPESYRGVFIDHLLSIFMAIVRLGNTNANVCEENVNKKDAETRVDKVNDELSCNIFKSKNIVPVVAAAYKFINRMDNLKLMNLSELPNVSRLLKVLGSPSNLSVNNGVITVRFNHDLKVYLNKIMVSYTKCENEQAMVKEAYESKKN